MKVGIVHGAAINPDGSLQLHTKARADVAIKAHESCTLELFIVCGKNEAEPIASYMISRGVDRKKIMVEPFSYSTLSNLYYCKILLSLLDSNETLEIHPISNYWHIPRLTYDAEKILGKEYRVECLSAEDPRDEEEVKRDKMLEKFKSFSDKILLSLGYGENFDREVFLESNKLGMIIVNEFFGDVDGIPPEVLKKV